MGLFNKVNQQVNDNRIEYNKRRREHKSGIAKYTADILTEDIELIRRLQSKVVETYDLFETGELKKSLRGFFSVNDEGTGKKASVRYVNYLRFLDMPNVKRKREAYHLYNRIVFGIIYNRTIGKLIHGYTDEIKAKYESEENI